MLTTVQHEMFFEDVCSDTRLETPAVGVSSVCRTVLHEVYADVGQFCFKVKKERNADALHFEEVRKLPVRLDFTVRAVSLCVSAASPSLLLCISGSCGPHTHQVSLCCTGSDFTKRKRERGTL